MLKNLIKKVVPRQLPASIVNYKILSQDFGQFKSMRMKQSVDTRGDPIPWYSYPAIEFINQLDLTHKHVFEYGSGNSTLFWSSRSKSLMSVEHDEHWYSHIRERLPDNVSYYLRQSISDYVNLIHNFDEKFDIIIIDGAHRLDCAVAALSKLNPTGFIILDNSDWMTTASRVLREADLIEVDMSGFGPINHYIWTTSFYFSMQVELKPAGTVQPRAGIGHSPQSG